MKLISKGATPLFSTPNCSYLPQNEQGLAKGLEMIAFPNTLFTLIEGKELLLVQSDEYPYPVYAEGHLLVPGNKPREIKLPSIDEIVSQMVSREGLPYVWGGNLVSRQFYGLDCSGLLYEATNGHTPRNTAELASFGEVARGDIKPLDLFIYSESPASWQGHVVIALDDKHSIESNFSFGGITISSRKLPGPIVHRRWHPDAL